MTTTSRVRWSDTVALLPGLGVRCLLQLGVPSRPYALQRLRAQDPRLHGIAVRAVRELGDLAGPCRDATIPS